MTKKKDDFCTQCITGWSHASQVGAQAKQRHGYVLQVAWSAVALEYCQMAAFLYWLVSQRRAAIAR
jgi:hypothetical protein